MPPSSPLNIAVLGAGKIGSAFAFQLARSGGHDVTVVARPGSSRLRELQRDAGIVDTGGKRAEVRVTGAIDEQAPYDLVVVTLLAHQIDAVLPALQRSAAKAILFMFNQFEPERLQEAVGAERCAFGMPFIQAMLVEGGRLRVTIGAAGQKTIIGRPEWVDLFNRAGLPAKLEPEIGLWLRCHTPMCIAFESVSVAGVRRGGGASWGEAMSLARGVQESFALIRGLGFPIYPRSKKRLAACPASVVATVLWSMSRVRSFRDLLASGQGECEALVDALMAAVPRADPPMVGARILAMKPR